MSKPKTPKTPPTALELIAEGAKQVMALYPGCESAALVVNHGIGLPDPVIRIYPEDERPKPGEPLPEPVRVVPLPRRNRAK